MQMTEFCDHLYNDSTDGYIQILKLNDENNIGIDEKYDRNNERRRKSRRNEKGLTKKQQELLSLKQQILQLKEEGLSN